MPLSSDSLKVGPDFGSNRIKHITDIFMEHGSRALLFLKSVLQVILQLFYCRLMQDREKAWNMGICGIFGIMVRKLGALNGHTGYMGASIKLRVYVIMISGC